MEFTYLRRTKLRIALEELRKAERELSDTAPALSLRAGSLAQAVELKIDALGR